MGTTEISLASSQCRDAVRPERERERGVCNEGRWDSGMGERDMIYDIPWRGNGSEYILIIHQHSIVSK